MTRISLIQPYDPIEVELDKDVVFHTVDVTKAVQEQLRDVDEEREKQLEAASEQLQAAVDASDEAKLARAVEQLEALQRADGYVAYVGKVLDVRLTAINGTRGRPSTALKAAWKANRVSISAINALLERIGQAEAARPPSPQVNS